MASIIIPIIITQGQYARAAKKTKNPITLAIAPIPDQSPLLAATIEAITKYKTKAIMCI